MEEKLITLLLSDSGVSALVGTRIFWSKMEPSEALPRIVLNVISDVPDYNMNSASGLRSARVQVDCYSSTYGGARSVSRAVEMAIGGYRGTSGTIKFDGIFVLEQRDVIEEDNTPDDLFGVSIDYQIWHKEISP